MNSPWQTRNGCWRIRRGLAKMRWTANPFWLEVLATMWRQLEFVMVLSGAVLASSIALAQQKPAPVDGGQPKNATVQQVSADNYYFEWALVFVMAGAAMFAVCRSSRRNA